MHKRFIIFEYDSISFQGEGKLRTIIIIIIIINTTDEGREGPLIGIKDVWLNSRYLY